MKAIMLMFDTLCRRMLPPYGCDFTHAPNFQRLAERTVTFDNAYVGSMPCMPARRELHTGRYNFLHRSWGPLEPFDDSAPRMLADAGVQTHLVSDHYHYWETGGATYHTRYDTWEIARGQEGEGWKGQVRDPEIPDTACGRSGKWWRQEWVNRAHMKREEDQPQPNTFRMGMEYLDENHDQDNWFLHIETFDPHEPFFTQQKYKDLYPRDYKGRHFDWPPYAYARQSPDEIAHCRREYMALLSMCDHYLGKLLDKMDELDLWKDTMLIVNTDHGFLLGEHDMWAKCWAPFYNEIAHMPLFVWDPRVGKAGERRSSLVQTIDLPATLLEYYGIEQPADMQGVPLRETLDHDKPIRKAGLFGIHGGHVNVTDGRYVYMRAPTRPDNRPLYNYTLMPTHMREFFSLDELRTAKIAPPFAFSKDTPLVRYDAHPSGDVKARAHSFGTMLFDLDEDPLQETPIKDDTIEKKMIEHMVELMKANEAPPEQYERLGVEA